MRIRHTKLVPVKDIVEISTYEFKSKTWKVVAKCKCGTWFVAESKHVGTNIVSCGCRMRSTRLSHGRSYTGTYRSWAHMKVRCQSAKGYFDRGIKYCERWETFDQFLSDMGERPEGTTLDRIDNGGDYCPENCRWATASQQQRNKRTSIQYSFEGQTVSLYELAERFNINSNTLQYRVRRGWSIEEAVNGKRNANPRS